jgi:23S rRNA (uracil-5-)-methyltransferase RumA
MCEHFGRCGGCAYLDITYEQELAIKSELLGGAEVLPSPRAEGYRNKMELAFGDGGRDSRLELGMRKKRSYYEVATPLDCVLICDEMKWLTRTVLDFFRESGETFFHRKTHTGTLRHLVIRKGEFTGEMLVNLSTTSALSTDLSPLIEKLAPRCVGILHSINDGVADAVKAENVRILHGRDYFYEEVCGLRFKVAHNAFFQTNSSGAEVLYGVVKNLIGHSATTALDLYCGTGTIAQIISPLFTQVTGVEIVESAVAAALENAAANNITNCTFHAADVLDWLRTNKPRPDLLILDPPRDGLHPKALPIIAALNAPHIIYVACKPASLFRDRELLAAHGYKQTTLTGIDMFPRTKHVEAVAGFELAGI